MNQDFSILTLVVQASFVVQVVMAGLLLGSLARWTVRRPAWWRKPSARTRSTSALSYAAASSPATASFMSRPLRKISGWGEATVTWIDPQRGA